MDVNHGWLSGTVTGDPKVFEFDSGARKQEFQVATKKVVYKDGRDQVVSLFWSVTRWLTGIPGELEDLFKGDGVLFQFALDQSPKTESGGGHTRLEAVSVSVTRPSRQRKTDVKPVDDPWAK